MAEAPRILLEHHLKRLKLPTFLREYEKLARQCAAEGLDHVQFLARLVELELIDRERRLVVRRIKQAGFPVVKQLESFDFKAIPSLNKMLVLDLARGEYIARRENVILTVDELGYVPLSQTGSELLFDVFSRRYENGTTIVTSNLPFQDRSIRVESMT